MSIDDLKTALIGYGTTELILRINGSKIEENQAYLFVSILRKLIGDISSSLSLTIVSSFVESNFFSKMKDYIIASSTVRCVNSP